MPKPIINGSISPIRKGVRISYDPANGITTTEEFESAGNNCGGLAAAYQRAGVSYVLDSNGVRSRLVATASRNRFIDETAIERWELLTNQQMLDIRENPTFKAMAQADMAQVLLDVQKHERGKEIDTSGYDSTMLALFALMIRGTTHYPVWAWTLRYTANVSNTYNAFTEANSGLGTIYTTSQAVSSVPTGRLRSTLQAIEAPAADDFTTWGWLKVAAQEVQSARNRIDVSAEYQLAQWANALYL